MMEGVILNQGVDRERVFCRIFRALPSKLLEMRLVLEPLLDEAYKLHSVGKELDLTLWSNLRQRYPPGSTHFLGVPDVNCFVDGLQHADEIEVCSAVLIVELFSEGQDSRKLGFYACFFKHLPLNSYFQSLALVDIASWELPELLDRPCFLDEKDFLL